MFALITYYEKGEHESEDGEAQPAEGSGEDEGCRPT